MYSFGERSQGHLKTLHPNLRLVLNQAIKIIDFSIIEGLRDKADQNTYYYNGTSKLVHPFSKHNRTSDMTLDRCEYEVSDAVDIAPYPSLYEDKEQMVYLAGIVVGIGASLGIEIRCGTDWNSDGELNNEDGQFFDPYHFEIIHK